MDSLNFLPDLVFIGGHQSLEGMSHLSKMLNSPVNRISIGFKCHFQKSIALNRFKLTYYLPTMEKEINV